MERIHGLILKNRNASEEALKNSILPKLIGIELNTTDEYFLINLIRVVDRFLDSSELNIKIIAAELGMSHSVVYKKLKSLTGQTIVEFIRDYRLYQASKLLTSLRISVTEACYSVGFLDRKYFRQIFKRKYGLTPSDYSRAHTK